MTDGRALHSLHRVDDDRLPPPIPKMLTRLPAGALKNVAALSSARSSVANAARTVPVHTLVLLPSSLR